MSRTRPRFRLVLGTFALLSSGSAAWACSSSEFISGGPLDLQVSSNSPVSVGDSLELRYDVVGMSLLGLVVTWGDATQDSIGFFGAQTAGGRVTHAYPSDGSFTITVEAVDQVDGTAVRDLAVTVDP